MEVRVTVYDYMHTRLAKPNYEYRAPKINLLLGQSAFHTQVCLDGKCSFYKKRTTLKNKKVRDTAFIWVESEIMRNSYLWLDDLD